MLVFAAKSKRSIVFTDSIELCIRDSCVLVCVLKNATRLLVFRLPRVKAMSKIMSRLVFYGNVRRHQ